MQFTNLVVHTLRTAFLFLTGAVTSATATATLTTASILGGLIVGIPTAAATYTTPTATELLNALGGSGLVKVGDFIDFYVRNDSAGAYAITLGGGTGVTLAPGNTNTVNQANTGLFRAIVTATAAPAITIYGLGRTAH